MKIKLKCGRKLTRHELNDSKIRQILARLAAREIKLSTADAELKVALAEMESTPEERVRKAVNLWSEGSLALKDLMQAMREAGIVP